QEPPRRRQAAPVRRNVFDQGPARRRRRRDRRHLPPALANARQGRRAVGLVHRLRQGRFSQGRAGQEGRQVMKTLLISGAAALLLAACGEYPQTIVYKQGEYHGKADARPYDAAPWNGDKAAWE